jgi:NADPH:quinone reductase-like Zn-dependent oxidoreductase
MIDKDLKVLAACDLWGQVYCTRWWVRCLTAGSHAGHGCCRDVQHVRARGSQSAGMSEGSMKAIVRHTYGSPDLFRLEEVPTPTAGETDVLVRVQAASANAGDWHLMRGKPFPFRLVAGLLKPKHTIIGTDIAGRVVAVGRRVTQLKPGDDVFGELSRSGFGGYAEYVVAPETALALKPSNASFEEAAATPTSGLTALQGLRKAKIQAGQRVLIHGAAGGVGTFAVQVAKSFSTEVTAVCGPDSVEVVRSIGADHVLDYTRDDFVQAGQRYDVILAVNGDRSIWDYRRALSQNGAYIMSGGSNRQLLDALLYGPLLSLGNQKFGNLLTRPSQSDLLFLKDLIETGKIKPVIDRTYTLREVPEAIRYIEEGHARGKVVVAVATNVN